MVYDKESKHTMTNNHNHTTTSRRKRIRIRNDVMTQQQPLWSSDIFSSADNCRRSFLFRHNGSKDPSNRIRRWITTSCIVVLLLITPVLSKDAKAAAAAVSTTPLHSPSPSLTISDTIEKEADINPTATSTSSSDSILSNKSKQQKHKKKYSRSVVVSQSTFMRRIQREWKDAIQLGIAYDWYRQERKTPRLKPTSRKAKTKQTVQGEDEEDETDDEEESEENENEEIVCTDLSDAEASDKDTDDDSKTPTATTYLCLGPIHKNLYHWHFTIEGMPDSVYENGLYHGRLILPKDYPASPPRVQILTPSGRFQVGKDICLSASHFHPETWNPSAWNLRTLLESLRLHMITPANEIGSCTETPAKRKLLALASRKYTATLYNNNNNRDRGIYINHEAMVQKGVFSKILEELQEEQHQKEELKYQKKILQLQKEQQQDQQQDQQENEEEQQEHNQQISKTTNRSKSSSDSGDRHDKKKHIPKHNINKNKSEKTTQRRGPSGRSGKSIMLKKYDNSLDFIKYYFQQIIIEKRNIVLIAPVCLLIYFLKFIISGSFF